MTSADAASYNAADNTAYNAAYNAAVMLLTVFTRTFYVVNTYHIRKTSCDERAMNVR